MNAKAQARKEMIIAGLVNVREKILRVVSSLPSEKLDQVFLGVWSVKDLLAHLVGWDVTNLEAAQEILAGQLPSFYAYYDRDWRSYNAILVEKYRLDDIGALLSSVRASQKRLIEFLQMVPAEEFRRDRGLRFKGYRVTIGAELEVEIRDEDEHYQQLTDFADQALARQEPL